MTDSDSTNIPYGYCYCGCGQKTKPASTTSASRNWVKGEPLKYVLGHNSYRTDPLYKEEDRGYETPCWIWQRACTPSGHGEWTIARENHSAYKVFYEKHRGPVPKGLHLHHLCDVPPCVNPDHLQPLTPAQHALTRKHVKLSQDDCREMARIYAEGGISYRLLGERFGVHTMTAYHAVNVRSK